MRSQWRPTACAFFGLVLAVATTARADQATPRAPGSTGTDANITRLTAGLLENAQYAHKPFDRALAGALLDRYTDALDPARTLFLQSDVDAFEAYGAALPDATRGAGSTAAARAIFGRYLERLAQQEAYVAASLHEAPFDYTGHDVYSYDREHAQRPRDLGAARDLWHQQLRAEYLQEKLADKSPSEIAGTLTRRHSQALRTAKALGDDEVLEIYLDTFAHVYDPHSDYLGHEQMESLSIAMDLSLFGIGATLEDADGYCKVRQLTPGGPAAKSGLLKPGDRIVAVSQPGQPPVDLVNLPLSRAVELIRGPKGTTVTLSILPAGAVDAAVPRTASLVRDQVKLDDQAAKARIVDMPDSHGQPLRLGVIELPSFYADNDGPAGAGRRSATTDVAKLLAKLKAENVRGIVLDVRDNGGGSLDEAIRLTGLFIRTGPVVQTRDQTGHIEVGTDADPAVAYDGPLVVLTSRFSASATEILSGALQDYGRAVIVGDPSTFGKGTVQTIVPLAHVMDQVHLLYAYDPGALKVTTSKFYRPSGASTQLRGVASDLVLPSSTDLPDVNESSLKNPLPWDVIPAAPYTRVDRVAPYLRALREDSARRIAAERDFVLLKDDAARIRKSVAEKSVSLNEADRRTEMAQAKSRYEEHQREERAERPDGTIAYEISLAKASSPGLPPPRTAPFRPDDASRSGVASDADGRDATSLGRAPADDIVLREGVRVLADYVRLVDGAVDAKNTPVKKRERSGRPIAAPRSDRAG